MDLSLLASTGLRFTAGARLSDHTTFKLGGPCAALIDCSNASQATRAVLAMRKNNIPFILMGFGSNILASDQGINAAIVRYTSDQALISRDNNILTVDAATQLDALAEYAVNAGLSGMTTFSGIPGTVGGAIAGNAGAYGAQISDSLIDINLLNTDDSTTTMPRGAIHFEYRDSDFKHDQRIILSARFSLASGDKNAMLKQRADIIREREQKHGRWQDSPCAGSFFRNVEPTSKAERRQAAGWFIEQSGGKELRIGGAHSYAHHANIITRDDGASALDVLKLTETIKQLVRSKTGIELVREVRLLGMFGEQGNAAGFW